MENTQTNYNNPRFKIPFHQGENKAIMLPIYNIPYIKADDQVSIVMHDDGEKLNEIFTTDSIKTLCETLKKYKFIRTHRSYLVNVAYIKEINRKRRKIILFCDTELPIPQPKITQLKSQIKALLMH